MALTYSVHKVYKPLFLIQKVNQRRLHLCIWDQCLGVFSRIFFVYKVYVTNVYVCIVIHCAKKLTANTVTETSKTEMIRLGIVEN